MPVMGADRRPARVDGEDGRGAGTPDSLRAGELAARAGISTDTLRHYERKGVLPRPRRLANGYRSYPPEALGRVQAIRAALALGFTLDELAPVFRARERGRPPCRAVRELAAGKLLAAQTQLAELTRLVETLQGLLTTWDRRLAATSPGEPAHLLEGLDPDRPSTLRRLPMTPPGRAGKPKRKGDSEP